MTLVIKAWFLLNLIVIILLVTFVKPSIESNGATRATIYGAECISPCEKAGYSYYWCYYKSDVNYQVSGVWDYCTPSNGVTRYGTKCTTSCSDDGTGYFWCETGSNHEWEYCSLDYDFNTYESTCMGIICRSPCKKNGYYHWCYISRALKIQDVCSPSDGSDASGNTCINTCRNYEGTKYNWCSVNAPDGSVWNYCSMNSNYHYAKTHENQTCGTACEKYGYNYYWCYSG